jgi:hypothetical protein
VFGWAFVVGAAVGSAIVVGSWLAIPSGPVLSGAPLQWVLQTTADLERDVVRDELHTRGTNVLWGYHCGVALMVLLSLTLLVAALSRPGPGR